MTFQEPPEIDYTESPIVQNSTGTQIELSKSVDTEDSLLLADGIYTYHSSTENAGNRIKVDRLGEQHLVQDVRNHNCWAEPRAEVPDPPDDQQVRNVSRMGCRLGKRVQS